MNSGFILKNSNNLMSLINNLVLLLTLQLLIIISRIKRTIKELRLDDTKEIIH